jgi:hypothetical protein
MSPPSQPLLERLDKNGRSLALLVRSDKDRIVVTSEYGAEVLARTGSFDELLFLPGDSVRDVEEIDGSLLWPPARWWSLAWATQWLAVGRLPPPRSRAARPSC